MAFLRLCKKNVEKKCLKFFIRIADIDLSLYNYLLIEGQINRIHLVSWSFPPDKGKPLERVGREDIDLSPLTP